MIPGYWLVLTVAAIVPGMGEPSAATGGSTTGCCNYPIFTPDAGCAADAYRCAIPTAWTLAIEVGFYAILPLFVLAMAWIGRRWRGRSWLTPELWAVAAIAAASLVIQAWFTPSGDLSTWLFFSPLGRGWWFAIGLGLAAVSVRVGQREVAPR